MNRSKIISKFAPSLEPSSLQLVSVLSDIEEDNKENKKVLEGLQAYIASRLSHIKKRIEAVSIKASSALFGDRRFLNEAFAFPVKLTPALFTTPVTIKDSILTTKAKGKEEVYAGKLHISSRRGTDFKIEDGKITIEKNLSHDYQELEIHLPKPGLLQVSFDKYDSVSVTDTYGRELIDKHITKTVAERAESSLVLRFHTNKRKTLRMDLKLTTSVFEALAEVETHPIPLGGVPLRQIGINTCDNYSEDYIDIQYMLSINGGAYVPIRPLNKQKNLSLPSILSIDSEETYSKELPPDTHRTRGFKYKLGEDEGLIRGRELWLLVKEDTSLDLPAPIVIDGVERSGSVPLKKGIHRIQAPAIKDSENLLGKSALSLSGNILSYEAEGKRVSKVIEYNKNPLYYQLITKGDIFLEEGDTHLFYKRGYLPVNNIRIKARLSSSVPSMPAYISSITIRGAYEKY